MAIQMTSYDVKTNKKWYHLIDQAQGYLINVTFIVNTLVLGPSCLFLIFDQCKFISLYLNRTGTRRAGVGGGGVHPPPLPCICLTVGV